MARAIRRSAAFCVAVVALAVVFVGIAASASAAPSGATTPSDCQRDIPVASQWGPITAVVGGERTTVARVVAWQEGRYPDIHVPSPLRGLSSQLMVTICLFQGEFDMPVAPPLPGATPLPVPNVIRLIFFDDGTVDFDSAGPLGHMQPDTPADLLGP